MADFQSNRKSKGRKKIAIEKIENNSARAVSFSKRKAGVFKKAHELSLLCGAHVAIVIFTLSGGVVSFGHPSIESVLRRFTDENPGQNVEDPDEDEGTMPRSALLAELNDLNDRKDKQSEIKKKRGKEIETGSESSIFSNEKLDQLDFNQLQHLKEKLEKLRDDLRRVPAARLSDGAGPSRTRGVDDVPEPSSPDQIVPASVVVAEPSSPKEINPASAVVAEPSNPKTNLANVEASPIPADWLTL